jgi:hypothetical protein
MTSKARARIGRPVKPPVAGERMSLGLKVTADIKARLDRAAEDSGRTQSQEAEKRIVSSFERNDLLTDVLSLAYGRPVAGILMMLGSAMTHAGVNTLLEAAGGPLSKDKDFTNWIDDPDAYEQAEQAVAAVLAACRPSGNVSRRKSAAGKHAASEIIRAARKKPKGKEEFEPFPSYAWTPDTLRSLLGPIASRIACDAVPSSNPFRLALAVSAAISELEGFVNKQPGFPPTEPVVSILEKHLGMFLRPDWKQRGQADEGDDSQAGQEELEAQIRRRA